MSRHLVRHASKVCAAAAMAAGVVLAGVVAPAQATGSDPREPRWSGGPTSDGLRGQASSDTWVESCSNQPVGTGTLTPELVASCMVVWRDDASTPRYDDSRDIWFEGLTDGPTAAAPVAQVAIETTGSTDPDVMPQYVLTAPPMPAVETAYAAPVQRYDATTDAYVPTAYTALWWRVTAARTGFNGYLAVVDWRELRLTRARYSFSLGIDPANWTEVPAAFTGGLFTLPQPKAPTAPRAAKATAGDKRATVSWTRPASLGTSPLIRYTVTSVPGGRTCTTTRTSCVVTGLANQKAYRFQVRAVTMAGTSPAGTSRGVVPKPFLKVKVGTKSKASKLTVDVDPNLRTGAYTFRVQKRNPKGAWPTVGTYATQGAKETRTLDLAKGTYRVVVIGKNGYQTTTSRSVALAR